MFAIGSSIAEGKPVKNQPGNRHENGAPHSTTLRKGYVFNSSFFQREPFHSQIARIINLLTNQLPVWLRPLFQGDGQQLIIHIHVHAPLETVAVHEIQFTQLHTDADRTGGSRHPLHIQQGHLFFCLQLN